MMPIDFPPIFVQGIQHKMGETAAAALLAALRQTPPTAIRHNPHKKNINNTALLPRKAVAWCADAYYLAERPLFTADPLFHAGCYYVQEAASMFIAEIWRQKIDNTQAICILDACAAPGGKSTLLAALMNPQSTLLANEIVRTRANVLAENLNKWGNANTFVSCNTPADVGKLSKHFDLMLVDAPCSGEGMFRKDPQAINEWNAQSNAMCARRQQQILDELYPALADNGLLIYSTCTFSEQENEDIVRYLTEKYAMESLPIALQDDWHISEITQHLNAEQTLWGYRFYPHLSEGEGFFVACLRKTATNEQHQGRIAKTKNTDHSQQKLSKSQQQTYLDQYLHTPDDFLPIMDGDTLFAVPKTSATVAKQWQQQLYLLKKGIELGTYKGKNLVPAPSLALSQQLSANTPDIPLHYTEAIAYLRREELTVSPDLPPAWYVVRYEGAALGWVKVLQGGRCNNYYPTHWRIKMQITQG